MTRLRPWFKRAPRVAIALAGLGAVAYVATRLWPVAQASRPAPAPVAFIELLDSDVARAVAGPFDVALSVTGTVHPLASATLLAAAAGEIQAVLVQEGDIVRAGQLLVQIDRREQLERVRQSASALDAARAQLAAARKTRDNNQTLLEQGFISRNAVDQSASQFDALRANVDGAESALALANKGLRECSVVAPLAGVISSRTANPGEKIAAGARLLEIIDLDRLELQVAVPSSEIARVLPGQTVNMVLDGVEAGVTGRVRTINPAVQAGSRAVTVHVSLPNPTHVIKAGMFARAEIVLSRQAAITLPPSALQVVGERDVVFAIDRGRLALRPVIKGRAGKTPDGAPAIEIVKGIDPGQQVVAHNLGQLRPGALIKLAAVAGQ